MQIEHKTEKGTICFFLPPTEADRFKFFNDEEPYLSYFIGAETFRKRFQKGFNLIGLTSDVTEEQLIKIFQPKMGVLYEMFGYDYLTSDIRNTFKSLMQHLKITDEKWIVLFKPND